MAGYHEISSAVIEAEAADTIEKRLQTAVVPVQIAPYALKQSIKRAIIDRRAVDKAQTRSRESKPLASHSSIPTPMAPLSDTQPIVSELNQRSAPHRRDSLVEVEVDAELFVDENRSEDEAAMEIAEATEANPTEANLQYGNASGSPLWYVPLPPCMILCLAFRNTF